MCKDSGQTLHTHTHTPTHTHTHTDGMEWNSTPRRHGRAGMVSPVDRGELLALPAPPCRASCACYLPGQPSTCRDYCFARPGVTSVEPGRGGPRRAPRPPVGTSPAVCGRPAITVLLGGRAGRGDERAGPAVRRYGLSQAGPCDNRAEDRRRHPLHSCLRSHLSSLRVSVHGAPRTEVRTYPQRSTASGPREVMES